MGPHIGESFSIDLDAPDQRYSANAQAVHGECTVEAEEMGRNASWCQWITEKDRRC